MSIEAMKQALEALENSYGYLPVKTGVERDVDKAITALRQAIEFAELVQKGTKAWADTPDDWVDDLRGGAEKSEPSQKPGKWVYPDCPETYSQTKLECARLKQSEQEPVAWVKFDSGQITHSEMTDGSGCDFDLIAAGFVPLYTAPPKREWVGLTDEEIQTVVNKVASGEYQYSDTFARAIEAKLMEKNT